MEQEMSVLSRRFFDEATSGQMSIQEAVALLEQEAKIRSLREKMQAVFPGEDLRSVLTEGLAHNHPEAGVESIKKKVRLWLNSDRIKSISKEDAIELCFILGLSFEKAEQFVLSVSGEGFHWRNPDEIVYIFALARGIDYPRARELNRKMAAALPRIREKKDLTPDSFTPLIRSEVSALNTEEELADYMLQAADRLGRCHNTAYQFFTEWMGILQHPLDENEVKAGVFEKEELSIRDVLREYLFDDSLGGLKKRAKGEEEKFILTTVQKSVRSSWPNEAMLSKMKNRQTDVTRKVLILLFLATDDGEEDDEEELTAEEMFEDLYQRLNDMLISCGFAVLDPRAPFDWLILYCMCARDIFEVDARMRAIFREMFGGSEEQPGEQAESE